MPVQLPGPLTEVQYDLGRNCCPAEIASRGCCPETSRGCPFRFPSVPVPPPNETTFRFQRIITRSTEVVDLCSKGIPPTSVCRLPCRTAFSAISSFGGSLRRYVDWLKACLTETALSLPGPGTGDKLLGVLASLAAASSNAKKNDNALVTAEHALPLILSATLIQWLPLSSSASKKDEPRLLTGSFQRTNQKPTRGNQDSPPRPYPAPVMPNICFAKRPLCLVAAGQRKKGNTLQCQASTQRHKRSGGWGNEPLAPS
jgi:hypothetical protein